MAARSARPDDTPLIVIVGETGSGKTALAIDLAKRFDGEIICADSRTVYVGMDIGTAKPTAEEQSGIPHHGLNLVEPGQQFTAYDFQQLAYRTIADIAARGKVPIMVGGTGLYIDSALYDFAFRSRHDALEREALAALTVEELQRRVVALGYDLPQNASNRRHLTRLIESGPAPRQPRKLRAHTLVLGLTLSPEELRPRIEERVKGMVVNGLVEEVRALSARYHNSEALKASEYRSIAQYIAGELSLDQAMQQIVRDDLRLAKRQRTWFRRSRDIRWLTYQHRQTEAVALVTTFLGR